ncbi:UNVERIFIED_ORG: hypothetical protein HNP28_002517 [Comamonas terrigena]
MFLTHDANKHPLSNAYGNGNHVWIAAEIQLRVPFFMVEFDQHEALDEGDDFSFSRTVLLARGDDVVKLVSTLAPQNSLKSVTLLSPTSRDVGGAWSLDQLTEIWEAKDPNDSFLKYKIFAKADGSHFVDSMMGTTVDQLQEWQQLTVLPTVNCRE